MFEDWSEDVPATYDAPPWPGLAAATDRHLALYRELWKARARGNSDPPVAHIRHKLLAERIGLKSDRQVRTLMSDLYHWGWVQPIRQLVSSTEGGRRRGAWCPTEWCR
jgi:hypothetical protein